MKIHKILTIFLKRLVLNRRNWGITASDKADFFVIDIIDVTDNFFIDN